MQIAHGGGLRFKPNSLEYRIISEWIAAGTPPPSAKDKEVVSLQVEPTQATLAIGDEHAVESDGAVLGRQHGGRHALGQVQLEQRRCRHASMTAAR